MWESTPGGERIYLRKDHKMAWVQRVRQFDDKWHAMVIARGTSRSRYIDGLEAAKAWAEETLKTL
jgi:hypothetical protein